MTTATTTRPVAPVPPARSVRPGVPSVLRHSATLAWRGVVKTIHSTEALLDVTLQPVIFLLLFVYVFGGAIAGDTTTYLQYALPGVLVQTVVFASAGTGTGLADDLSRGSSTASAACPSPGPPRCSAPSVPTWSATSPPG